MYKWHQLGLIILASFLLSHRGYAAPSSMQQPLDQMVAIVNNSIITETELSQEITKIKKQFIAGHTTVPNNQVLRSQVLEQLINRKLQLDLAKEMSVTVSDGEVDKAIQSIATNNHVTVQQLYQEVARQGLSKADYRNEIHDQFLIHKVQQRSLNGKVSVSPDEVDDFMRSASWQALNAKEYHLEDILITLPDAPSTQQIQDAKKRAQALMNKLSHATNFHNVAVGDTDNSKAIQDGDLGWRKLPEIPSAFSNPLLQAKENDILGPIQTANGFHIIHVAGIRTMSMEGTPAEQRKKIQELLYDRKYEEALQTWITKIRSEAFIKTQLEG